MSSFNQSQRDPLRIVRADRQTDRRRREGATWMRRVDSPAKFRNEKSSGNDNDTRSPSSSRLRFLSAMQRDRKPPRVLRVIPIRVSVSANHLIAPSSSTVLFTREGGRVGQEIVSRKAAETIGRTDESTTDGVRQAVGAPVSYFAGRGLGVGCRHSFGSHRGSLYRAFCHVWRRADTFIMKLETPRDGRDDDCRFVWQALLQRTKRAGNQALASTRGPHGIRQTT